MKLSPRLQRLQSWWSMSVVPTSGERIIGTVQIVLNLALLVFGLLARVTEIWQTKPEVPPRPPVPPSEPPPTLPAVPDTQGPVSETNKVDRLSVEVDR